MDPAGTDYDFKKILQEMRDDYWRSLELSDDDAGAVLREFVVVQLGNTRFALPAADCREVLRPPRIVKVPGAGEHIRGIINLRGEIVAVTDLTPLLGLERSELPPQPQLVVVAANGLTTALLVARVEGLIHVAIDTIEPVAAGLSGLQHDIVSGQLQQTGGTLIFLDLHRTLERPELIIDQKASERL
jgi:purine-binding chemotaxis protein CheW